MILYSVELFDEKEKNENKRGNINQKHEKGC
jgi:hypothetical protein